ncbi:hypothetical protein TIFTF001_016034 [Ficus carica]|uniref:Uncharacterized protein n=1 Tax=Ficus carica TaxID=3494 RepID=A0AA88D8E1_FICCA|nr:hypothetical protein TIFTF001_016034 [Ficus carica]
MGGRVKKGGPGRPRDVEVHKRRLAHTWQTRDGWSHVGRGIGPLRPIEWKEASGETLHVTGRTREF